LIQNRNQENTISKKEFDGYAIWTEIYSSDFKDLERRGSLELANTANIIKIQDSTETKHELIIDTTNVYSLRFK
jgi:hypothetical protein